MTLMTTGLYNEPAGAYLVCVLSLIAADWSVRGNVASLPEIARYRRRTALGRMRRLGPGEGQLIRLLPAYRSPINDR